MLDVIVESVWIATRQLRFWGVETGTRMTVVRLNEDGLFIHSPVTLDAPMRDAIDALGPVKAIVAPSLFHHLAVAEWTRAFPGAAVCACPGLESKRSDLPWNRVLGEQPEAEWRDEIDQVFFSARPLENEIVFFHRPSKTLICADALFNLANHASLVTRIVARMIGNRKPGTTFFERVLIRDRASARHQVDRMLVWNPERIILAHGDIVESGGAAALRHAYAWL